MRPCGNRRCPLAQPDGDSARCGREAVAHNVPAAAGRIAQAAERDLAGRRPRRHDVVGVTGCGFVEHGVEIGSAGGGPCAGGYIACRACQLDSDRPYQHRPCAPRHRSGRRLYRIRALRYPIPPVARVVLERIGQVVRNRRVPRVQTIEAQRADGAHFGEDLIHRERRLPLLYGSQADWSVQCV